MIFKNVCGENISALGLGTMRLPLLSDKDSDIDTVKTAEMIRMAIEGGINYFDTAWGYHSGESEKVVGEALSHYPRSSFKLASKFPGYDLVNMPHVEEIFEKQLVRCRVDYFDFFLFHNVCEMNIEQYLDPKYGIYDYLIKQKKNGRIKHLGFSVHGTLQTMKRFLDAYGKDIEFCQVQLNYLDLSFQKAGAKLELLQKLGIPVWVMEPLRGGKLTALSPEHEKRLRALRPNASPTEWALRFLQSLPGIGVTLSGMSTPEQLSDNMKIFSEEKPLSNDEMKVLLEIAGEITGIKSLPCTSCRYCVSHCPQGLNIPELIRLYNEHVFSGGGFIAPMTLSSYSDDKKPSACIGCRSCEAVCPQTIKISEAMSDFSELLGLK